MLPTPDTSHVPYSRVYEPAEDSFLMIDTLALPAETEFLQTRFSASSTSSSSPSPSGAPFVVEIGSGSGVVLAFVVAQAATLFGTGSSPDSCIPLALAVDVNSFALKATTETVRRAVAEETKTKTATGHFVGAVRSDLVSALRPGQVDVLLFNPPYVPTPSLPAVEADAAIQKDNFAMESHLLELAYAGGHDGMETTDRLLASLPSVLSPRGCAYILLCAQNRPDAVKERIRQWPSDTEGVSWHAETVGSSGKQAGWEKLQITVAVNQQGGRQRDTGDDGRHGERVLQAFVVHMSGRALQLGREVVEGGDGMAKVVDDLLQLVAVDKAVAQHLGQPRAQSRLHNSRRDGDAPHHTQRPHKVDSRRRHGMVRVVKGGQRCEEQAGVHNALAQVGRDRVHKVLPGARVCYIESERGHEAVAHDHEARAGAHERREAAIPAGHDDAGNEAADGRRERRNRQPRTGPGGRVLQHNLEKQRQTEEVGIGREADTDVGGLRCQRQASAQHAQGNDGRDLLLGGGVGSLLGAHKEGKQDNAAAQAQPDPWTAPGQLVAAEAQADQLHRDAGHQQKGAGHIDARPPRRAGVEDVRCALFLLCAICVLCVLCVDCMPASEAAEDATAHNERCDTHGHLNRKAPAPADRVGHGAAKGRAADGTKAKDAVLHGLVHAAPPEGDEVRVDNRGHGHEAASAEAGEGPHAVERKHVGSGCTAEAADGKDGCGHEEAGAAADKVRHAAVEGLEGGARHEVGRREPRSSIGSAKVGRDDGICRCGNGAVKAGEEDVGHDGELDGGEPGRRCPGVGFVFDTVRAVLCSGRVVEAVDVDVVAGCDSDGQQRLAFVC
ncbi:n -glutamine methyltransferase mtq2 [Ophiostoma piceae UAMH 11346]|uniref:N-glutamine methyltransferase mtq2 n=1 Tax=Ophiostoma piceae (strain UAMH 11346) TaxID=1262450 RepID=S3C1X7_OPHP1|nr:n -glutamine methyltransferase mtq2 [Ophiostoma piceae UAMH 11346]